MNKELFKEKVYEKYEKQLKKKSKFGITSIIQKVAAIFMVGTLGVTAYAGVTGNLDLEKMGLFKLSQNYEDSIVSINKEIENEYYKITLQNMAGDSSYIIAEYKIELTPKALNELKAVEYDSINGYKLGMDYKAIVNSKEVNNTGEHTEKISDSEYVYYQKINVMDFEESNLHLEIQLENLYIGDYGIRINEDNINEWFNIPDIDKSEIKVNEVKIGKKIETDVVIDKSKEVKFEKQEKTINEHTKIAIEKVGNTKFETYIKAKTITENISWKEYNENPFEFESFIITGENDTSLQYQIYDGATSGKKYYRENDTKALEIEEMNALKDDDIIRVEESFTILINEQENHKLKINSVKSRMYNDRTNEEKEYYDKAKWYKLVEGDAKYSATSGLGGIFEVEKITVDNEYVTFYYNESGVIGDEWKIIIRKNNGIMNYIHPIKEEKKGVNGKENKIVFAREDYGRVGLCGYGMSTDEYDNMLKDMKDLEFTLLFGVVTEKIGEPFEIDVPEQNIETAKFENLQIIEQ